MRPKSHITRTSPSRLSGGIFISAVFPGEIHAKLTTVNNLVIAISMRQMEYNHERIKQVLNSSNTINYSGMIFPAVKHGDAPVNKISTVLSKISQLTTYYSRLITALAHYRIAALIHCQFVEQQRLRRDILSPFCRWQGFCNYLCE